VLRTRCSPLVRMLLPPFGAPVVPGSQLGRVVNLHTSRSGVKHCVRHRRWCGGHAPEGAEEQPTSPTQNYQLEA